MALIQHITLASRLCTAALILALCINSAPVTDRPMPYYLVEELPANTLIGNVAIDAKLSEKYSSEVMRNLSYRILRQVNEEGLSVGLFDLDKSTGTMKTAVQIDRDVVCPKKENCLVFIDIAVYPAQYSQIINTMVDIIDINDHVPTFPDPVINLRISESIYPGAVLDLPVATDPDSIEYSIEHYELISSAQKFELKLTPKERPTDVQLVIKERLDREETNFYQFKVIAYDGGEPSKFGSVLINLEVEDENDNDPQFANSTYEVFVLENSPLGTTIARMNAKDLDSDDDATLSYLFSEATKERYGNIFGIDQDSGAVYVKGHLDFEIKSTYSLTVIADDHGTMSLPAHATLLVQVEDDNDHAPQINVNTRTESGVAMISQDSNIGTFVAEVSVTDPDEKDNGKVNCFLDDSNSRLFQILDSDLMEYVIVTYTQIDRDSPKALKLIVTCHDLGKNQMTSSVDVNVRLITANENPPRFRRITYTATILESNHVGDTITVVSASDPDEGQNGEVRYKLAVDDTDTFQIHPTSGIITTNAVFDHESTHTMDIKVIAFDLGSPVTLSSTATVILSIIDIDDEPPQFTQEFFAFGTFENQAPGAEVGALTATDPDGPPYNQFTFHFLPSLSEDSSNTFSINPLSGHIYTKRPLDREQQPVYYMTAVVRSITELTHSSTASVTIYVADKNDNDPIISWPTPDNNTIYISDQTPQDQNIAWVQATDKDLGGNGKLAYSIEDDPEGIFEMSIGTGALSIKKDLSTVEEDMLQVMILVKDQGFPERVTKSLLHVVINNTVQLTKPEEKPPVNVIHINHNTTIIVSLTSASLVLIFLLVVAIVLVRKQQQEKKQTTFSNNIQPQLTSGRTEAQTMLELREDAPDGRESLHDDWPGVKGHKGQANLASSETSNPCHQHYQKDSNRHVQLSMDENDANTRMQHNEAHMQHNLPRIQPTTLTIEDILKPSVDLRKAQRTSSFSSNLTSPRCLMLNSACSLENTEQRHMNSPSCSTDQGAQQFADPGKVKNINELKSNV